MTESKEREVMDSAAKLMCDPAAMVGIGSKCWEVGEYGEKYRWMTRFMDGVLNGDQIPFVIRSNWDLKEAVRNPVAVSGMTSLTTYFKHCHSFMDLYMPGMAYTADLQLYFDCYREYGPIEGPFFDEPNYRFADNTIAGERFNNFVVYLREQARSRRVKKKLADWKAGLTHQRDAVSAYLLGLAAGNEKLLVVRGDLYWREDALDAEDTMPRMSWQRDHDGHWVQVASEVPQGHGRAETRARIDSGAAMRDRDSFFDNQRGADKDLFEHMVGYVVKLEQGGKHRAYHFHCIFLFDAREKRDVSELMKRIEERWSYVTGGLGLLYNCHERPDEERLRTQGTWAIDPVDCSDPTQVTRLTDYVSWYFAKDRGQIVRIKPTAKAQTLTKGR